MVCAQQVFIEIYSDVRHHAWSQTAEELDVLCVEPRGKAGREIFLRDPQSHSWGV